MAIIGAATPPKPVPGKAPAQAAGGAARAPAKPKKAKASASGNAADKPRRSRDPLKQLGLSHPAHALLVAPAEYIDCRHPVTHVSPQFTGDGEARVYKLTFTGRANGRDHTKNDIWRVPSPQLLDLDALSGATLYSTRSSRLWLEDDAGNELAMWVFGLPTDWLDLKAGDAVWVLGRIERFGQQLSLQLQDRIPPHALGSVWPRYVGKPGEIAGPRVLAVVRLALANAESVQLAEAHVLEQTGMSEAEICEQVLEGGPFASLREALLALHMPSSPQLGAAALDVGRRLTAIAMQAAAFRRHARQPNERSALRIATDALDRLAAHLAAQGMRLTQDQRQVAGRIMARLAEPEPLSALLSGDVGTGKTMSFLIPAVAAHMAGAQVAIVAPVRLLADQIAREAQERFGDMLHGVERVDGAISDPRALLVGTQGLINAAQRSGYLPNFLVFDEQQRLSTSQREACVGSHTHTLEVSATPIPRTLAASIYASVEQLQLTHCPVTKHITSDIVGLADKQRVLTALREALARGERCAVIYPRVNPTPDSAPHECVTGAFESLLRAFPQDAVMIHGELSAAEVDENLALFRSGQRRLAVASTILEIGIDVPSITVMVVRDAGNFGLSQLHQLRGRLARRGGSGQFLMVVEDPQALPPETLQRLETVRTTLDGYAIAEQDLLARGFGDLDGEAQAGSSNTLFKLIKLGARDFVGHQIRQRQRNQALLDRMARMGQAGKAPPAAVRPAAAAATPAPTQPEPPQHIEPAPGQRNLF